MNCLIPGGNIKVVGKCLQYLAKIGEELSIEAKPGHLSFYTVNQSKTTFAVCNFKDIFFSSYEYCEDAKSSENSIIMCKVQMKAILNIFRSLKEKKTEYCKISFEQNALKIIVIFKYKNGVLIKQRLNLLDGESTNLDYDLEQHANKISNTGSFYGHLFSNFQPSDPDLTMEISKQRVLARNYYKTFNNNVKGIRSQISSNKTEYTVYEIGEETAITLSLRPFRAIVALAETFDLPVSLRFDKGGDLFVIHLHSATFVVDCVMSTVDPLGITQTTTTVNPPTMPKLSLSGIANGGEDTQLSQQEKDGIEDLDWDDNCDFNNDVPIAKKQKTVRSNDKSEENRKKRGNNEKMDKENELAVEVPMDVMDDDGAMDIAEDYGKIFTQDSPRTRKIKNLFKKILRDEPEEPFLRGKVLAPNSDSE